MRLRTLFLIVACSLAASLQAADEFKEFVLKDGTVYADVPVIEETDTHYIVTLPEAEGKTIRVEKTIAKADVKRAIRPTQEEIDYRKLKRFFLQEDAVNPQSVEDFKFQTERFLKKYPESTGKVEIESELSKYNDVLKHLEAGDVKYKGEWVPKSVQERMSYTINSSRLLEMMKSRIAMKDYRNALNFYDRLVAEYLASEAMVDAEKLVLPTAIQYERQLKQKAANAKRKEEERQKKNNELAKRNPKERTRQLELQRGEQTKYNKEHQERTQRERNAGVKRWLPVNEYNASTIEGATYSVTSFIATKKKEQEVKKDDAPYVGKGDEAIKKFWELADAGNYKEARDQLSLLRGYRISESIRTPMDNVVKELYDVSMKAEAEARKEKDAARKAEIEKRAAERKALREKERKIREENARKAQEMREKANTSKKKEAGEDSAKKSEPASAPAAEAPKE